jgi:hypothetical protein
MEPLSAWGFAMIQSLLKMNDCGRPRDTHLSPSHFLPSTIETNCNEKSNYTLFVCLINNV